MAGRAWDIIYSDDDDDTLEDDLTSARFCSRTTHSDYKVSCRGDVATWCFRCIMETEWSLAEKQSAFSKLLHNPKFLNAETDYSTLQVMLLTEVHSVLLQSRALRLYDDGRLFNNDVLKYLEFIKDAGICEAIPKIAKVRLPPSLKTEFDRQWYSVGYYCVSILGLVSRLESSSELFELGIIPGPNYCRRLKAAKSDFLVRSLEAQMMPDILGMISGNRGVIELLRSPWALKGVLAAYPRACSMVVDADGLAILCKVFAPRCLKNLVVSRTKAGLLNYDRTLVGFDHGAGPRPDKNPFNMTEQELIDYLSKRAIIALEDLGDILVSICKYNRSYCFQLLDQSPVTKWLGWLNVPLREETDMLGIKLSTRLLLIVLKQGPRAVEVLTDSHDVIILLERLLYLPYDCLLGPLLQVLKIILGTRGEPRRRVIRSSQILYAVACLIHTSVRSLQIEAFDILNDILKGDTRQLLIQLIGKRLLRKVQIVVGIAGTKRDKEMHFRWRQLDENITRYCERYMETAADEDRYLIQKSKVFSSSHKVESRQHELRKRGNAAFVEGRYKEAIEEYTIGILVASIPVSDIDAVLFSNRAECYLRLQKYEEAIFDATRAINCMFRSSSVYSKTCFRRAKANLSLGRYYEAFNDVTVCVKSDPKEPKFQELYSQLEEMWEKNGFSRERVREEMVFGSEAESMWKDIEKKREQSKKAESSKENEEAESLKENKKAMQEVKQQATNREERMGKEKKSKEQKSKDGKPTSTKVNEKEVVKKKKVHVCAECGTEASGMKKCARCATYFCNKECQSKAWPKHKLTCK